MNNLYGSYRQNKFSDIFYSADYFLSEFNNSGIKNLDNIINSSYLLTDDKIKAVYYLLFANYGNSVVASSDTTRFKERLFSLIIQYAPNMFRQLEIQDRLRAFTEDELLTGSSSITNNAQNPNVLGSTSELDYISNQQTNKFKKGKLSAYQDIIVSLQSDFIKIFVEKFKKLFLSIIQPEEPLLYESEE